MAAPEASNPYVSPQVVEPSFRGGWLLSRGYFLGLTTATAASMVATYATGWWQWADQHDRSAYIFLFNSCIFLPSVMHNAASYLLWFTLALWPVSLAAWWWRKQ